MVQVALLRGINVGASHRVPMADLRDRLGTAGYEDVRTYVQSGNVVLGSKLIPDELATMLAEQLEEWYGFAIPVVVRSGEQLAAVIAANPLGEVADNDKYHVVTFLDAEPDPAKLAAVADQAGEGEQLAHRGREIYTWHPQGQARSKLSLALTSAKLGVLATSRNWRTVNTLNEMARG